MTVSTPDPIDATSDGGRTPPPADRFTKWPFIIAAGLWAITVVPLVYDIGGLFLDPSALPAFIFLPLALIGWITVLLIALCRLRWRVVLSTAGAPLTFLALAFPTLLFSDQMHFLTMRPIYSIEVARADPHEGKVKKLSWMWSGGNNYQEWLFYDGPDRYAPQPGSAEYVNDNCPIGSSCSLHVKHMGGHFYLSTWRW